MKLAFAAPSLQGLDSMEADVLALGVFSDDRPLRDLAGLADWRLNGQVSRVILDERFEGRLGEVLMLPCGHRIGPGRCVLFGLGAGTGFDEQRLANACEWIWATLARLRTPSVAMPLPGRHRSTLSAGASARLVVAAASKAYEAEGDFLRLQLAVRQEDRREVRGSLEVRQLASAVDFVGGSR